MAAQKTININLLPQEEFASSTGGKALHWLLSTFRYLVITTEMIVIMAFLSRFYFDSRSADLNDEITQKQDFIEAYGEFEKDFRQTQLRLAIFNALSKENNLISPHLDRITSSMPNNLFLTRIEIQPNNSITIEGSSFFEQDIAQFIANLQSNKEFVSVSLGNIESLSGSSLVQFNIQISLQNI